MIERIAPYWKAVVAFITPAVVTLIAAVQETSAGGSSITAEEWIEILVACFATSGGVWWVTNKPKPKDPAEPVEPPAAG